MTANPWPKITSGNRPAAEHADRKHDGEEVPAPRHEVLTRDSDLPGHHGYRGERSLSATVSVNATGNPGPHGAGAEADSRERRDGQVLTADPDYAAVRGDAEPRPGRAPDVPSPKQDSSIRGRQTLILATKSTRARTAS